MRAEDARDRANAATDVRARDTWLQTAGTWQQMAAYEDKHNPPQSVPALK
jgi:hypothetical protein